LRIVLKIVAGLVLGLVVLAGLAVAYREVRTAQRAHATALNGPNSVQDARFIRIGGLDQWVSIRGEDRANPVLMIVHGGPGGSMLPNQHLLRRWEKTFTVVQWDQPGAGKTFSRARAAGTGTLTIDRIAGDGVQVADWVRQRLGKRKVILLGHSWGTIVGSEMVRRRPDQFSAYVATGVVADMPRGEALGYQLLTERLAREGDPEALAALKAIGPPPYRDPATLYAERRVLFAHPLASERHRQVEANMSGIFEPQLSLWDGLQYAAAERYSGRWLYRTVETYEAASHGLRFETPVFIFQGAEDIQTPAALAAEYFGRVEAPRKELLLLPGGGHFAIISLRDRFLAELTSRVRPLAVAADQSVAAIPRP
jgi:pimeloyl-ACP methyl ester carboxylesterase